MSDEVFHFIVYLLPWLLVVGIALATIRARRPGSARPSAMKIAIAGVTSLLAVAGGFVYGFLYDYVVAHGLHHAGDGLPTRTGFITLGFVVVQLLAGIYLVHGVRGRNEQSASNVA